MGLTQSKRDEVLYRIENDPRYFIESAFRIVNKERADVPFLLNEPQKKYLENRTYYDLILKARKEGFCLDPNTLILTSDLRWVKIKDVAVGQKVVSVDENRPVGRGNGRRMREAIVEGTRTVQETAYRLVMSNGEELIATSKHRFMTRIRGSVGTLWREVGKMKVGEHIRFITKPWVDGDFEDAWFGGLTDGEGCLREKKSGGVELTVSQRFGPVWDRMSAYAKRDGYVCREDTDNRKYYRYGGQTQRRQKLGRLVFARMNEMFRLIGKTRPTRFIGMKWWEGKDLPGKRSGEAWSRVLSIERLPSREMIDLQTSTSTFIANGFVSHNSSLIAALWVHACIFKRNTRAVLMSHEAEATKRLFERVQYFINHIEINGQKFTIRLGEDSKSQLTFPDTNSSFWIGTAGSKAFGRGDDITHCHCSEAAHYENQDNLDGLLQACVPTAYRVFETTANGVGEAFWRLWTESVSRGTKAKWKRHFFSWFEDHTNRVDAEGCDEIQLSDSDKALKKKLNLDMGQILWYASKRQEMVKKELLAQEYPSTPEEAFVMSGSNFFDQKKVQVLIKEASEWSEQNKPWKIERDSVYYEKPRSSCMYVAGADTSEGAHDYSVLKIINVSNRREAFRFRAKVGVDYFYKVCDKVCREFGTCLLGVERNNHGHAVLLGLQNDCHYPNLYFERNETRLVGDAFKPLKAGWTTTAQNKTMLFDQLKYAVEGKYEDDEEHFTPQITWIDDVFLGECLTIKDEDGKLGAISGRYDDDVVATAIAFQMYLIQRKFVDSGGQSIANLVGIQGRREAE